MFDEKDFRERMQKIEILTQEVEALPDRNARTKAIELVQLLMDYHGAGLERVMEIIADNNSSKGVFTGLANDGLASSLLLLYGLHPLAIETRVEQAIEKVRPDLQSHKGDAELVGIDDGVVRLRLIGSNGCPSTSEILKQAIEKAIYEAAPDVAAIKIEGASEPKKSNGFVQIQGIQHTAVT